MTTTVIVALPGDPRETRIVATLGHPAHGLHVVRRCVDIPDLLAVAASGAATSALIGGRLLRLDREVIARIAASGVGVVGWAVDPDDAEALRRLGVERVLAADAPPGTIVAALHEAAGSGLSQTDRYAMTNQDHHARVRSAPPVVADAVAKTTAQARAMPEHATPQSAHNPAVTLDRPDRSSAPRLGGRSGGAEATGWSLLRSRRGRRAASGTPNARPDDESAAEGLHGLVAVWGPVGSPGRTSVAVALADEVSRQRHGTVTLVDADTYGPSIDQMLGLLDDDVPGIAAAARLAHHGRLDARGLEGLLRRVGAGCDVLTGIARADRWPELRAAAMDPVWDALVSRGGVVVADMGFGLEQDEELSFDTLAPRRHAVGLGLLQRADHVVAVGAADAVGVRRLVHGLDALRETDPPGRVTVVLNRCPARGRTRLVADVAALLAEHGHRHEVVGIVEDAKGFANARARGLTLAEAAPRSVARDGIRAVIRTMTASSEGFRLHDRVAG